MDRLALFEVFLRVADAGSFTRAADLLGMPRSSVSTAVRALEERLGTRLLHRTTRHVALTIDGEALRERCARLVGDAEELEGLFRQDTAGPSGKVRVDVPARIGRLFLTPALPAFLARYPAIDVALGVTDRTVGLVEEAVDCVLRVGPIGDSSLVARRLGELPLVSVASPDYLARHGTPRTPADLDTHLVVHYASPTSGRIAPWEWVEGGTVRERAMRGRVTVNGVEAYVACAQAGLGLIQIPAFDARAHVAAGELVLVLTEYPPPSLPVAVLYPHRLHLSRRLTVFIDWMVEVLADAMMLAPGVVHREERT